MLALAAESGAALPGGLIVEQRASVLYVDGEGTYDDLAERCYLMGQGLGISGEGLHYRSMTRALADDAAALRADVSRLGITFVIVDSCGPAAGFEPEGADAAVRVFNALRSLGPTVTKLVIAHVSKLTADQRQGAARPYGSVYCQNLPRSSWELRRSDDDTGDDLVVALYHRKANRGRLHPQPIGLRFTFGADSITLSRADLADSPDLLARASLPQQIIKTLVRGAMTAGQLADALNASEDSVLKALQRLAVKGVVVKVNDVKPYLWGLAKR